MDDIIVIILTLVFIVASIFGQKKKRKPIPDAETKQQPARDNFWQMLDEEWKEARQPDSPPQQKPIEKQETTNIDSEPYTIQHEKKGARITAKKPEKTKTAITKVKKKKFPLKEAVIYSEILNRKYT